MKELLTFYLKYLHKNPLCFKLDLLAMTWRNRIQNTAALLEKAKQSGFLILLIILISPAYAYEDCVLITDGKLTDISIENNKIVDVYPLVTVMNEKNTLIVHPLQEGETRICVLKNNKNIVMFNIKVKSDKTLIDEVEGFDILTIDSPDGNYDNEKFELDIPPI